MLKIFISVSFQISTTCTSTSYYDTSLMQCSACGTNMQSSSDYLSCICVSGMIKTSNSSSFQCTVCTNGVPSEDQTTCQLCPGSVSSNQCVCGANQIIEEFTTTNLHLATKQCVTCSPNTYPGLNSFSCQSCPGAFMVRDSNYQCTCNNKAYWSSDNNCIPMNDTIAQNIENLYSVNDNIVTYTNLQTSTGIITLTISSDTFNYLYFDAAYSCQKYSDVVSCQLLGNLCVLQNYNLQTTACEFYKQYIDQGRLFYGNDTVGLLDQERVAMEVTFDPNDNTKVNLLQFKLAEFNLNGTFIGYSNLSDQLILCPHSYIVGELYRKFGTNVQLTCNLDLSVYIASAETTFFELYLIDSNNTLIDVPVLIKNYVDVNGNQPNMGSDESLWQLVRRFYIYDNVSGKLGSGSYSANSQTSYLQYLKEAMVQIKLINDQDQKIYVPLLILNYQTRSVSYITTIDSTDTISFSSEYTMDTSNFWKVAKGVFIGICVLVLIVAIIRLYIWTKNNPSQHVRESYSTQLLIQFFWYFTGSWGFIMFWYLIGVTAYWFIFYKMQYHVYALVPPQDTFLTNYLPFVIVFAIVWVSQFLWIVYIIRKQGNVDVIIIDREQPQEALKPGIDKIMAAIYKSENSYRKYISAWRSIMVTNEFSELQASRYISIELTLFILLFFLKGLSWEDLARAKPQLTVSDQGISLVPFNPVLRFFLTSFLFIIIGYVQIVIRKVLSTWFPTDIQNFVDLCVISNISVLVLDDSLHGYYIHGVTPLIKADMALEELHSGLNEEKMKINRKKSLLDPNEEDLYTFEVYLPFEMRIKYDQIFQMAYSDQEKNRKSIDYRKTERTRYKLNENFKSFFDPEIKNLRNFVFEKSSLQRILNMPPADMGSLTGSAFFYKDPGMSIENIFFLGKEFSLLLMDLLMFDLMDIAVGNSLVSALTTYLFSKIIMYARYSVGENNIAKKTMIDKSFII